MDVSAVKTAVDIGVSGYGTQGNSAAQSVIGVLPADVNKVSGTTQPVAAPANDQANKKTVNVEDLHRITAAMNQFVQAMDTNTHIQFKLHQKTNELMVQIVDQKSDKVLREYPSQEFLDTIAAIRTYVGLMLDKHA